MNEHPVLIGSERRLRGRGLAPGGRALVAFALGLGLTMAMLCLLGIGIPVAHAATTTLTVDTTNDIFLAAVAQAVPQAPTARCVALSTWRT